MTSTQRARHWRRTTYLMAVTMGLWLFFSLGVHLLAPALDAISLSGLSLGFSMAAQGSIVAFVVMVFWFARRQNAIDEAHDAAED